MISKQQLDGMNREQLLNLRADIDVALEEQKERNKQALEAEFRAKLKAAGITEEEMSRTLMAKKPASAPKPPHYAAGKLWQHPSDPSITWNGIGPRPKKVKELDALGIRLIEAAPANGNTKEPMAAAS